MRWLFLSLVIVAIVACRDGQPAPRDRLAICVDSVAPAEAGAQEERLGKDVVEAALFEGTKSPYWPPPEFPSDPPPIVRERCSTKPALLEGESGWDSKLVEHPSCDALFLYIVPKADIERVFGSSRRWGLLLAEHSCPTDDCIPLTDAIYISPRDIEDVKFVSRALKMSLGLVGPDDPAVTDYNFD